jgi:hypothetical protein
VFPDLTPAAARALGRTLIDLADTADQDAL